MFSASSEVIKMVTYINYIINNHDLETQTQVLLQIVRDRLIDEHDKGESIRAYNSLAFMTAERVTERIYHEWRARVQASVEKAIQGKAD